MVEAVPLAGGGRIAGVGAAIITDQGETDVTVREVGEILPPAPAGLTGVRILHTLCGKCATGRYENPPDFAELM